MKLFYRKIGEGQPLMILHGLFGQGDNWNSLARKFAENGFEVYLVDLRNHGLSPHSDVWNYEVMGDDILELINDTGLSAGNRIILLGHSMGGKVAMEFAIQHQKLLRRLIVVDIAPKYYPPHHQDILEALNAIDLDKIKTRREAEDVLSKYITDLGTKQLLLKNLYWKEKGEQSNKSDQLAWRFNLKVITQQINKIGGAIPDDIVCTTPTLFIRGGKSNYISEDDLNVIHKIFPNSILETIADAGHWVHAEKPKELFECVIGFVK